MKIINISISGAIGKMGTVLIKRVKNFRHIKLISLTDKKNSLYINKIKVQKNSLLAFKNTDVIIDFSKPESTMMILKIAKKLKKKVVIGTTGFSNKQDIEIKKLSKKIAIFKSGNMSYGINLVLGITKILAKKLSKKYQISIKDDHHIKKVDYPSGTALMLANAIAKGKNNDLDRIKGKIILNKKGQPDKNKINFYIKRKGKTIGKHSVNFNNSIEKIELKHSAFSRNIFADGALNAALLISKKNKGLFNMQDMLELK
jgi:4-hydroxy-tetrahydrodipicolinate reductase